MTDITEPIEASTPVFPSKDDDTYNPGLAALEYASIQIMASMCSANTQTGLTTDFLADKAVSAAKALIDRLRRE